ncbi:hypothetical protein ACOME3_005020 [Neoechinorhynchus agilis]
MEKTVLGKEEPTEDPHELALLIHKTESGQMDEIIKDAVVEEQLFVDQIEAYVDQPGKDALVFQGEPIEAIYLEPTKKTSLLYKDGRFGKRASALSFTQGNPILSMNLIKVREKDAEDWKMMRQRLVMAMATPQKISYNASNLPIAKTGISSPPNRLSRLKRESSLTGFYRLTDEQAIADVEAAGGEVNTEQTNVSQDSNEQHEDSTIDWSKLKRGTNVIVEFSSDDKFEGNIHECLTNEVVIQKTQTEEFWRIPMSKILQKAVVIKFVGPVGEKRKKR